MSTARYEHPTEESVKSVWGGTFHNILPRGSFIISQDYATGNLKIRVKCDGWNAEGIIRVIDIPSWVDGTDLLGRRLIDLAKEVRHNMDGKTIESVEKELAKYKEAVKHLSFQLEMAEGRSDAAVKVNEVRKLALEQAAEFVMDYGIPGSGEELEIMCDQIKRLPIHKDVRV